MTEHEVDRIIAGMIHSHVRLCPANGECACMGCVNIKGISKEEFEAWQKRQPNVGEKP